MPDTHTHTIESGSARVSVEADDAARAVSEAQRNWAFNNGGVVNEVKPCKCGKQPTVTGDYVGNVIIKCECGAIVSEEFTEDAVAKWNNMSETVDDIARRIAEKICSRYDKMDTQAAIASVLAAELAPLIQRAEAAERELQDQRRLGAVAGKEMMVVCRERDALRKLLTEAESLLGRHHDSGLPSPARFPNGRCPVCTATGVYPNDIFGRIESALMVPAAKEGT